MAVTNNIYQKQIKYHVFNAVTNSVLTDLVPVFTIQPAFPTSVIKINTSFKNVWRTWGTALPTLLADLVIFCPLGPIGPTNFKNSDKKDITESCFDTKDLNQQIFVEHDVKQPNPNPEHDYDQMKTFIINSLEKMQILKL